MAKSKYKHYVSDRVVSETHLTPLVFDKIVEQLRMGNTRKTAYLMAGIRDKTFAEWMRRGREPEWTRGGQITPDVELFQEFYQAVLEAEADCESYHVTNVREQAAGDWRASIEWLKRRHPATWGERQQLTTVNVDIDMAQLTVEQLARISRGEDPQHVIGPQSGTDPGSGSAGDASAEDAQ